MTNLHALNRTLDQEVLALFRGASLECLVCGEFVLHADRAIVCPECGSKFAAERAGGATLHWALQAG